MSSSPCSDVPGISGLLHRLGLDISDLVHGLALCFLHGIRQLLGLALCFLHGFRLGVFGDSLLTPECFQVAIGLLHRLDLSIFGLLHGGSTNTLSSRASFCAGRPSALRLRRSLIARLLLALAVLGTVHGGWGAFLLRRNAFSECKAGLLPRGDAKRPSAPKKSHRARSFGSCGLGNRTRRLRRLSSAEERIFSECKAGLIPRGDTKRPSAPKKSHRARSSGSCGLGNRTREILSP